MEEEVFFDGEFGKISGVLHYIERGRETVIVIPGFSANKKFGAKIHSETLNEIGINALRIDLDDWGESDLDFKKYASIPNYVKQVEASINFIRKRGLKEISLLGTSFGGIIALATALTHPEIKRIFLRAPVLDFQKHQEKKFGKDIERYRKLGTLPLTKDNKTIYYNFNCYESAKNYSMFERAKEIKQPIMIIQGDKDESIDYKVAEKVVNLFPSAKLKIIKGADHTLGINGNYEKGKQIMKDFFLQPIKL